jgi:hypothetical protein
MMKDTLDLYNSQHKMHYDTITYYTEEIAGLEKEREKKRKELEKEEKAFMGSKRKKVEAKKKKQAEKEEKKREKKEKNPEKLPNVMTVRTSLLRTRTEEKALIAIAIGEHPQGCRCPPSYPTLSGCHDSVQQ